MGSAETRKEMLELIQRNTIPLHSPRCVHMIMVLLTVFGSDDNDESVRRIHQTALSMLRNHLMAHSRQPDSDMQRILLCVEALPKISEKRIRILQETALAFATSKVWMNS